ncbi:uncharacterized protein LOC119668803 [Teleopsis dalmanni]|uniref:uncharacterized protein LOC119668803 n=1 Tax=Teleopsis dalmanni TaxID=139649 RepID=UPI0018CD7819|nr:uncharacterized protein LOC119668803 [Teleopsis dalmanni]
MQKMNKRYKTSELTSHDDSTNCFSSRSASFLCSNKSNTLLNIEGDLAAEYKTNKTTIRNGKSKKPTNNPVKNNFHTKSANQIYNFSPDPLPMGKQPNYKPSKISLNKKLQYGQEDFDDKSVTSESSIYSDSSINISERLTGGIGEFEVLDKLTRNLGKAPRDCSVNVPVKLPKRPSKLNIINLEFPQPKKPEKEVKVGPVTRGTQTIYRVSSAQTVPYLPEVKNDPEEFVRLELFKLPKLLDGVKRPGVYEVEVLERERKRWDFLKELKEQFRQEVKTQKELIHASKHQKILEAFEWEQWIAREEYIQECQMLRLEIVIRMFNKREKEIITRSDLRVTLTTNRLLAAYDKEVKKINVEHKREMRRIEWQIEKKKLSSESRNITHELSYPGSEFYAPHIRFGVNPKRLHFTGGRMAYEARMADLENKVVNMKNLVCPFAKLKRWAKPKQLLTEVEQNFCSDKNLKKLYDTLKSIHDEALNKKRIHPKCLIERERSTIDVAPPKPPKPPPPRMVILIKPIPPPPEKERSHKIFDPKAFITRLNKERRKEELEGILAEYTGSTIGWLMRFLTEEMGRLEEQRKFHFIGILALKERWRREAAEAGMRQKENNLRILLEQVYDFCDSSQDDEFFNAVFVEDRTSSFRAKEEAIAIAKDIDKDLSRWLDSFKTIQHPLNFDKLRYLLKDMVFPDRKKARAHFESKEIVRGIIEDDLLGYIERLFESFDITESILNETIDRGIDNDLYYFSNDCQSDCDCIQECTCRVARKEAKAILRKVIRYAVPGRRWMDSTERVADNNVSDLLDDVFGKMDKNQIMAGTFEKICPVRKPHLYDIQRSKEKMDSEDIWDTMIKKVVKKKVEPTEVTSEDYDEMYDEEWSSEEYDLHSVKSNINILDKMCGHMWSSDDDSSEKRRKSSILRASTFPISTRTTILEETPTITDFVSYEHTISGTENLSSGVELYDSTYVIGKNLKNATDTSSQKKIGEISEDVEVGSDEMSEDYEIETQSEEETEKQIEVQKIQKAQKVQEKQDAQERSEVDEEEGNAETENEEKQDHTDVTDELEKVDIEEEREQVDIEDGEEKTDIADKNEDIDETEVQS